MMDLLLCVEEPQPTEGWMKTGTIMVQVIYTNHETGPTKEPKRQRSK